MDTLSSVMMIWPAPYEEEGRGWGVSVLNEEGHFKWLHNIQPNALGSSTGPSTFGALGKVYLHRPPPPHPRTYDVPRLAPSAGSAFETQGQQES